MYTDNRSCYDWVCTRNPHDNKVTIMFDDLLKQYAQTRAQLDSSPFVLKENQNDALYTAYATELKNAYSWINKKGQSSENNTIYFYDLHTDTLMQFCYNMLLKEANNQDKTNTNILLQQLNALWDIKLTF